jgi:tRNA threonylcarbamoyladenosine biosynthesis protein TsaB
VAGVTLAMDASAGDGTIAVLRNGAVVAECTVPMRSGDDERFLPAVLATIADAGATPRDLTRIVAGAGPGSFTALRVVGATAKGFAIGRGLPLYAVPSLALIVGAADAAREGRWLAVLDALRGDRHLALVTVGRDGAVTEVGSLGLAPEAEVPARAAALGARVIGPGAVVDAAPHARGVARCAALIEAAGPVPLDAWEPVYGRLAEAQVKWEAAEGRPLPPSRGGE